MNASGRRNHGMAAHLATNVSLSSMTRRRLASAAYTLHVYNYFSDSNFVVLSIPVPSSTGLLLEAKIPAQTGMWIVTPDFERGGGPSLAVVHLDALLRGAHLFGIAGKDFNTCKVGDIRIHRVT
ncbi:hypothetical protein B0H13DRAFT_2491663 [Mycena leptocephala]|nr:hypothetical protein B0H13DRAFT_2491663 [Mycena leptocephala]